MGDFIRVYLILMMSSLKPKRAIYIFRLFTTCKMRIKVTYCISYSVE